ncbi:uncharacterized protein METZ01_LOCUS403502 [marine metagenome]|uniref:Uncharacterized protein n=1 Tax=marine metagenome TaxID=408172 RepID=A0A382VXN9_9ZZZZ
MVFLGDSYRSGLCIGAPSGWQRDYYRLILGSTPSVSIILRKLTFTVLSSWTERRV